MYASRSLHARRTVLHSTSDIKIHTKFFQFSKHDSMNIIKTFTAPVSVMYTYKIIKVNAVYKN